MRHVKLVWCGCPFSLSKKAWRECWCYSQKVEMKWPMNMIEELVHAFSCAYIELWMYLGSLESTQEARVALGYRLEQLLRFFCALQASHVLHNSMYAR